MCSYGRPRWKAAELAGVLTYGCSVSVQPTAFPCWSSRMWTGPTSSTDRGRSLRSVSTTPEATTGSAMIYSVSWRRPTATNWSSTCSHIVTTAAGIPPSTVHSRYFRKRTTTGCGWPGTRVTRATTHSATTMINCSALMTEIMTGGWLETVPSRVEVDSGTHDVHCVRWTVVEIASETSTGTAWLRAAGICRLPGCGCLANNLQGSLLQGRI